MKPDPLPNLQKWLRDFSRSENLEASFDPIVDHLSPLIFQTAYRKSGNRELAEDVTQSVFLIIAKKAPSLAKHAALLGWIHETTRTETLRTLRTLARRRKREEAAMKHLERPPETNRELLEVLDESMKCLSASEKELVLMKYFEDRSYQSITAITGRSESAEKMRLKRALEKMSSWLGRKGVALSVTGLGSVLGTEMAKGGPVLAIKTTALASQSSLLQTLVAMSPTKLALGTSLLVLAGAAQPISAAWKDLQEVRETKTRLEQVPVKSTRPRLQITTGNGQEENISNIVDTLTNVPKDKYTNKELGLKLIDSVEFRDQALLHQLDQILAQFDTEEITELARSLNTLSGERSPRSAIEHLMEFLPGDWSPVKKIDWALALPTDEEIPTSIFHSWLSSDRASARKWLIQQTNAGTLPMTGVRNDPEGRLWKTLMRPLEPWPGKDLRAETFLNLPEAKRKRLSHYRVEMIPRSVIHQEQGIDTALEIIRRTDDSSERHWIKALVNSGQAPKTAPEFETWLSELNFNEIEQNWAMSFFEEEEQQ